jgi:glutaredoxin
MRLIPIAAILLCAAGLAHAAQLYKWVDADGKVHYTDQPPPADARSAERKRLGDKPGTQGLPYALQQAMRKFPVTLYTAAECGDPCKKASAYLGKRGIPFGTKDAGDEEVAKAMTALTGKRELPVMTVGTTTLSGFEPGAWGQALDAAGYPSSAVLPTGATQQAANKPQPATAGEGTPGAGGQTGNRKP